MLNYISGDIVTENYQIFCHQVNCQSKMGLGLAKQISIRYPEVATAYYNFTFKCYDEGVPLLGKNLYVKCKDGRWCVNMFAQDKYGTDKRYTDYDAFDSCLERLKEKLSKSDQSLEVAFPDHIGCGLAGGEWKVILEKLTKFSEEVKQKVYIVKRK